ncbi:MAG: TraR/DksA C4-type zinc finger protein [Pelobacteraceae bacterium]
MATKTNVTKESAPKAVKKASPSPASEKAVVPPKKSVSAEASKSTKSTAKAKLQPSSGELGAVSEPAEKPVQEAPSKVIEVESAPPKATLAENQDQKWQEIRLILEKLKEDTLREIRKSVKNGTEAVAAIEPGGDIYDQASSERDRELGLLLGDREREKIHSIDEALLRIDEGDYGICEECDEDIPLGRLKAMPFTRHCVKCKSDLEKLQAQTKRVEEERAYREIPLGAEEEES